MSQYRIIAIAIMCNLGVAKASTYHRIKSPTQSDETCRLQVASQEIWGKPSHNVYQSDIAKVKAYRGPLPKGEQGIEFITEIPSDKGNSPYLATWSATRDDVRFEDGYAKISINIVKNTQCKNSL